MKFSVPVDSFHPAFVAAFAAAAKKTTLPVLTHVKCVALPEGELILQGTNNEVGVVTRVLGAEVEEPGEAILHGAKMSAVLKEQPGRRGKAEGDGPPPGLAVEADGRGVTVRTARARHQLGAFPAEQFPDVEALVFATSPVAELPADVLVQAIRRAGFAATDDQEDERFDTRGVLIHLKGGRMRFASMQPSLGSVSWATPTRAVVDGSAMVHPSSLRLLASVLPGGGEPIEVRMAAGEPCPAVCFATPQGTLYMRTVDATVPPIERLLPKAEVQPLAAWADAGPLFRATGEAMVNADLTSQRVSYALRPAGGVASTQAEGAQSDVEFEVPQFAGETFDVSLNSRAVRTVGRALGKEQAHCQVYRVNGLLRVLFRYGTPECGGLAALMAMT